MAESSTALGALLGRLRRERYTGENRCWPCTVLNVGLLGAVAVALGAVAVPLGVLAFGAGVGAIWLRGYLVPYTPRITGRFFGSHAGPEQLDGELSVDGGRADSPDGQPTDADGSDEPGDDGAAVVSALLDSGVLTEQGEELSLSPAFRDAWWSEIRALRENDPEELADALDAAVGWAADVSVVTEEEQYWVVLGDEDASAADETWLSPPAALADLAAVYALEAQTDVGSWERTLAASALRQFLERCPVCDADLVMASPHACCGSPRSSTLSVESVLSCPSCDEALAAFEKVGEQSP